MISVKLTSLFFLVICTRPGSLSSYFSSKQEGTLLSGNISYRLPNNTVPRLYIINLEPHIDDIDFTFNGTSSTLFEVLYPTDNVIVHVSELIEIDKAYTKIIHSNGTILKPMTQGWNSTVEFFQMKFDYTLDIGNYSIEFKWKGYDAPDFMGFYRAFYKTKDENGSEVIEYLATSQFQPTAARGAFPCWDEPGMKAEFEVSLKHYTHYKALSNMPVKSVVPADGGKVWTSFERSPPMPTYLSVFIVTPYPHHANEHGNITMWAPDPELENTKLAFEKSLRIIPVLEEYTGIPYPLPKMDQAMIPQYPAGATEHWGLISYGPSILFHPEIGDVDRSDFAVTITAHEIAHQWFGNLVTPAWWDDVWLSEAFATYFQNKILDKIMDNWNAMNLFDTGMRNHVSFVAGKQRDPIKWTPETPREIEKMFGPVTYRKGAAVIEMLEHILTEPVFQDGIRKYLNKHKYSSVVTDDLWQALQEAYSEKQLSLHLSIKEIMDPWLKQNGYPVINVTRDYETGNVTVTQMNVRDSEPNNFWTIPINYATSSQPDFTSTRPTHWLPRSNESLIINNIQMNDWVILNIQNKGFYRVNYDWENWKRIAHYLNSDNYEKIHVLNRAQLLYDIIHFATKEPRYFELVIDIISYLHRENNYLPWTALSQIIERGNVMHFMNTPYYETLSKWILHLMDNIINHIGFDDNVNENHLTSLARNALLPVACILGHRGCKTAASMKLVDILTNKSMHAISRYRKDEAYRSGLIDANETVWDLMMDAHFADPEEESGYRYLGCSNNHTLMKKYLDMALSENQTLDTNDFYLAFMSLTRYTREKIDFAIDYFIGNYNRIEKHFSAENSTEEGSSLNIIVQKLSSVITTENQCEKFTKFLNETMAQGKMNEQGNEAINTAKRSVVTNNETAAMINTFFNKSSFFTNFTKELDNQKI